LGASAILLPSGLWEDKNWEVGEKRCNRRLCEGIEESSNLLLSSIRGGDGGPIDLREPGYFIRHSFLTGQATESQSTNLLTSWVRTRKESDGEGRWGDSAHKKDELQLVRERIWRRRIGVKEGKLKKGVPGESKEYGHRMACRKLRGGVRWPANEACWSKYTKGC